MNKNKTNDYISNIIKILLIIFSIGGVILSVFDAKKDGYFTSSFSRLLYFTAQSNLWIGFTTIFLLIYKNKSYKIKKMLFVLKYFFTVAITMTGIVFCFLLAPFSDNSYKPWVFANVITHVLSPITAIFNYLYDKEKFYLSKKHLFLSLIPAFFYFFIIGILEELHVDFGRGEYYPYFFMNFHSPSGIFGFSKQYPFYVGTFYWLTFFSFIYLLISFIYYKIANKNYTKKCLRKKLSKVNLTYK